MLVVLPTISVVPRLESPAPKGAVFSVTVLSTSARVPSLVMPPPSWSARFSPTTLGQPSVARLIPSMNSQYMARLSRTARKTFSWASSVFA